MVRLQTIALLASALGATAEVFNITDTFILRTGIKACVKKYHGVYEANIMSNLLFTSWDDISVPEGCSVTLRGMSTGPMPVSLIFTGDPTWEKLRFLTCDYQCNLNISNVIFTGANHDLGPGGSILMGNGGTGIFTNVSFRGGAAPQGGAVGLLKGATATFANCQFEDNTCFGHANTFGGAVYVQQSTATFDNCSFSNNIVNWYGGAIYIGPDAAAVVTSSFFHDNHADSNNSHNKGNGDAIFVDGGTLFYDCNQDDLDFGLDDESYPPTPAHVTFVQHCDSGEPDFSQGYPTAVTDYKKFMPLCASSPKVSCKGSNDNQLYLCQDNMCVPSTTGSGLDLGSCNQVCGDTPPSELYTCEDNACVPSNTTGVDLTTCQTVCGL